MNIECKEYGQRQVLIYDRPFQDTASILKNHIHNEMWIEYYYFE